MEPWLEVLSRAVKASNHTKVAKRLQVSRTSVSLLLAGKYVGSTDRMKGRVEAVLGGGEVECPHLKAALSAHDCLGWQRRPQPTSAPEDLRHWLACRTCPIGKGVKKLRQLPAPAPAPEVPRAE